jgi:hypothetical protein
LGHPRTAAGISAAAIDALIDEYRAGVAIATRDFPMDVADASAYAARRGNPRSKPSGKVGDEIAQGKLSMKVSTKNAAHSVGYANLDATSSNFLQNNE